MRLSMRHCAIPQPLRCPNLSLPPVFFPNDTPPLFSRMEESEEIDRPKYDRCTNNCARTVCSKEGKKHFFQALNRLMLIEADNKDALRSKRTIGILREVFPEISQVSRCRKTRKKEKKSCRRPGHVIDHCRWGKIHFPPSPPLLRLRPPPFYLAPPPAPGRRGPPFIFRSTIVYYHACDVDCRSRGVDREAGDKADLERTVRRFPALKRANWEIISADENVSLVNSPCRFKAEEKLFASESAFLPRKLVAARLIHDSRWEFPRFPCVSSFSADCATNAFIYLFINQLTLPSPSPSAN